MTDDAPDPKYAKAIALNEKFRGVLTPEVLEEAERLHRELSYLSPEELFRPYTL
jgi:hypothetical protein